MITIRVAENKLIVHLKTLLLVRVGLVIVRLSVLEKGDSLVLREMLFIAGKQVGNNADGVVYDCYV